MLHVTPDRALLQFRSPKAGVGSSNLPGGAGIGGPELHHH